MRKIRLSRMCCVVIFLVFPNMAWSQYDTDDSSREALIQFRDGQVDDARFGKSGTLADFKVSGEYVNALLGKYGLVEVRRVFEYVPEFAMIGDKQIRLPNFDNYYVLKFEDSSEADGFIASLRPTGDVASIESNSIGFGANTGSEPIDLYWDHADADSSQWWMHGSDTDPTIYSVNAEAAWRWRTDDSATSVALLDEGLMLGHPDIDARGDDYCFRNDCWEHGTLVAGILAATHNSVGLAGMLDGPDLIGYNVRKIKSVQKHVDQILDAVLNEDVDMLCTASWYVDGTNVYYKIYSEAIRKAWQTAYLAGKPSVAAGGNFNEDRLAYPANYGISVIGVGSTDKYGDRSSFPYHTGVNMDFLAPGEGMITTQTPGTVNTDFYKIVAWGTSIAMPVVAGSIGVLHSIAEEQYPGLDFIAEDYTALLAHSATDIVGGAATVGRDTVSGWGRIDAGGAANSFVGANGIGFHQHFGGSIVDSSSSVIDVRMFGFANEGLNEGEYYPVKWFKIESAVSWSASQTVVGNARSWGRHVDSNGYLLPEPEYIHQHPDVTGYSGGPNLYNINHSEADLSSITLSGCDFSTYAYRVYHQDYPDSNFVIANLGPVDPANAEIGYGVVGQKMEIFGGSVSSNTTLDGEYWIDQDIVVEPGATLTINSGSVLHVADYDEANAGQDSLRIEIIVKGGFVVDGSLGSEVEFLSGAGLGYAAGDWYGISLRDSCGTVDIRGAIVKHAEYGIRCVGENIEIADSVIDSCGIGIYVLDGTGSVEDTEIKNCVDRGFSATGSGANPITYELSGVNSHDNMYGFYFGVGTNGCTIIGGSKAEDNQLDGMYCRSRMNIGPRLELVGNGQNGLVITKVGFQAAGVVDSVKALSNIYGVGVKVDSVSFPEIRNCEIKSNYINVKSMNAAKPVLGDISAGEGMNNWIQNGGKHDVVNAGTSATILAENCYWGPLVGGLPPVDNTGAVAIYPWLTAEPLISWRLQFENSVQRTGILTVGPNPFNPVTTIRYEVVNDQDHVKLGVYDLAGRLVVSLVNEQQVRGAKRVVWRGVSAGGLSVASGVYFLRLQLGSELVVEKVTLVR